MPIILIMLLTASCARVPWPEPPFGFGGSGSLALTAFAFLALLGAVFVLSRWAASAVKAAPARRHEIANQYGRYRRILGHVNLVIGIVAVVGLGWGWTVWNRVISPDGVQRVAPFAELLVPAPYLLTLFASWLLYYDVERQFHAVGQPDRSFWSRAGYFFTQFRAFAFQVMLPVFLCAAHQTFVRLAPEAAESWISAAFAVATVPLVFIVLPLLLRPVLGLKAMPPGPTRSRLEDLARKVNFRYANLLVWPTRGAMTNALVVGVAPWARYVVFTDRLVETLSPDELDAVFGHEVGHAKHWHLPYYLLFLVLSILVVGLCVDLSFQQLSVAGWVDSKAWKAWAGLPPLAVLVVYLFIVFGYLSRKCERQADLYGCRMASGGDGVSANGIDAMIRALTRVADAAGMDSRTGAAEDASRWRRSLALLRSWQHGSIPSRIRFLAVVMEQPDLERRAQRRVYLLRWALVGGLAAAIVAFGAVVGWEKVALMLGQL